MTHTYNCLLNIITENPKAQGFQIQSVSSYCLSPKHALNIAPILVKSTIMNLQSFLIFTTMLLAFIYIYIWRKRERMHDAAVTMVIFIALQDIIYVLYHIFIIYNALTV